MPFSQDGGISGSPTSAVLSPVSVSSLMASAISDSNGNGRSDVADVVWLFNRL
jgi:hypothetical protein